METSPYWKKIWYNVTGRNKLIAEDDIRNVLDSVRKDLHRGICIYKKFTQQNFDEWKTSSNLTGETTGAERLAWKLSKTLNLETAMAWKIFCNFLMFEYHTLLEDIVNVTNFELHHDKLLEQAWLFYSSERMYLIKTWKYILENSISAHHKFNDLYMRFISSCKLNNLRQSFYEQFKCLLDEITNETCDNCPSLKDWVNRNLQEQFEILSSIILTEELVPLEVAEFKELFSIFKLHNFTGDPKYYKVSELVKPEELRTIRRLEVVALVIGLHIFWKNTNIWRPQAPEIEKLLMTATYESELYILLLAWTTLQMTLPQKVAMEKFNSHYHKFTKAALKENVFVLMYEITTDRIIQNSSIFPVIQKNFYNLLDYVCDKFDHDGSLMKHKGVTELCTELIKNEELAEKFFHGGGEHASIIYKILYEMFPCSFRQFSHVILELIKHQSLIKQVLPVLCNFRYFTEEATERYDEGVVRLLQTYYPLKCVKVSAHSEATIFIKNNKRFLRYEANFGYFEVAEEIMHEAVIRRYFPENSHRGIELYFEIIEVLLKQFCIDSDDIRSIFDNIGRLLISLSKRENVNYNLMKNCLDIYGTLMPRNGDQIMEMLVINNFMPTVTKNPKDLNNYFDKNFLQPNVILSAIREQMNRGEYGILFSYVNLVKLTPRTEHNVLRVHIPSLSFLFAQLFQIHLDTKYADINDKYKITLLCLEIMLDILNGTPDSAFDYDKIMYEFCYHVIVNFEPTVQVLFRIFRISNVHLHTRMLKEFNWDNPLTFAIIKCVKACINIFIHIFALHNRQEKSLEDTPLLNKFLDNTVKPSSLRLLISYLDHAFDPTVPKLACQLLKKIANDPSIPILALLELNSYQIQNMFLEKLRDPLQEENIKVAILELITLCIEKQNGLTAAFFDLNQNASKRFGPSENDSVITFIEEYLENIQTNTNYLKSPVQSAILDLFHTLWMYRKDSLVKQLTQGKKFWSILTDPLFRDVKLTNRTYSQIFNILTLELFKSKGTNDEINEILDKFFNKTSNYAQIWCDHIIACLDDNHAQVQGYSLLRSWKNLLISVVLTYPQCLRATETQHLLAETCMNGLIQHFAHPDDIRILTACADLYLFLIKSWPNNYYSNHHKTFTSLTRVFDYLNKYYDLVNNPFKETMLCIAIQTTKDLRDFVPTNSDLVGDYLESVGAIFDKEYRKIINLDVTKAEQKIFNEWSLLLVFGSNLISLEFTKTHPSWFILMQFAKRIMVSIGLLASNPSLFRIAKIAVQCLINYAQNANIDEFLNMDYEIFFDSTRPPKRYINTNDLTYKNALPWYFEDWWSTYTGIVQFMIVLFDKMHHRRLMVFLSFISMHEDIIKNALRLPRVTADTTALQLTLTCLNFCCKLLTRRQEWKVAQNDVYRGIIRAIYDTINAVTFIFLRPKVLTFFTTEKEGTILRLVELIPTDPLVKIMDELMKLIAMSCQCLLKAGPSLHSLLCAPIETGCVNDVNIDFDFHIPQLYQGSSSEKITYGTILCLLHFLCKTITYIHTQKLSPQKPAKERRLEESKDNNYITLVCPDYAGGYTISERYNLLSSEISGLSAPWLMKLNITNVTFALEALGSLVAAQTYITLHLREIDPGLKQHFKRELCSELMYFYEFIRKRFVDTKQCRIFENMVYRRYVGRHLPYLADSDGGDGEHYAKKCMFDAPTSTEDDEAESSGSDNTKEAYDTDFEQSNPNVFFTPEDFQEIHVGKQRSMLETFGINRTLGRTREKWYYGHMDFDGQPIRLPIEKVVLKYPKLPELKDGDYLLFLSHWFIFFCDITH